MSGPFGSSQWMYSSGFYSHTISNSLRLNDGDSPHLAITPGSAGNRRTFTWSAWIKLGDLANGTDQITLFDASSSSSEQHGIVYSGQQFYVFGYTSSFTYRKLLTAQHRDPSAWMNLVVAFDTTDGTAADRIKIYVNGTRQTDFSGTNTNPSQNYDTGFNNTVAHGLGGRIYDTANYFDGYISEVNLIDGTALGPDSFGQTKDGIWIPKNTSGLTFGTNGFRLEFKQTGTSQNASGIGADTSGETNHLSVTNLVAGDVVPDSPTNNFATLNPLDNYNTGATLSEGNLKWTIGAADGASRSTYVMTAGKWYVEFLTNNDYIGVVSGNAVITTVNGTQTIYYAQDGTKRVNGSSSSYGAAHSDGDIIGIALDLDSGTQTVNFYKNNSAQGALDLTDVGNEGYSVSCASGSGSTNATANFGQDSSFAGAETAQGNADGNGQGDFYYAPPSGFLALCSANLPDPAIDPAQDDTPADHFNTVLYTGTGSSHAITGVGFSPDFTWIKKRNGTTDHQLVNSVVGYPNGTLLSNATDAEYTDAARVDSTDADGFTVSSPGQVNASSDTYVAWNWLAGTAFSNDASATSVGTIDSSGQVNTKAGFSIIKYSGSNSGSSFAHGLSAAPEFIIIKQRTEAANWTVAATVSGWTYSSDYLFLNTTAAKATNGGSSLFTSAPSSTVVNIGGGSLTSTAGEDLIAYCFHSVEGYSKVGTYLGNGNADGTFVFTGFRPAWIMIKNASGAGGWEIHDNKRVGYNPADETLDANTSAAEATGNNLDILSNGFKVRHTYGTANTSGSTYIYLAFAEQPFKYANAR